MARNVAVPTLTSFQPKRPNGTAIIVAPGGAFHYLMMDHEGYDVARWLADLGVTAFVLKYRVQRTPDDDEELVAFREQLGRELPHPDHLEVDPPTGHPGAEEGRLWGEADARQAIRYLRTHAAELNIDAGRIGIMGFSAGGGIAINAALEFDATSRPDFVGGIRSLTTMSRWHRFRRPASTRPGTRLGGRSNCTSSAVAGMASDSIGSTCSRTHGSSCFANG